MTNTNGITKITSKSPITLDSIKPSAYKAKTLTAQIRQTVTLDASYPSARVESDMNKSMFNIEEFNLPAKTYISEEKKIAFVYVPLGTTVEAMEAKLKIANEAGATIYKVLSNKPILDSNQQAGIDAGLTTIDIIGDKQAVRYPAGDAQEGKLIYDKAGKVQYRRTFFWDAPKADIDLRDGDEYMTPTIEAELKGAHVLPGQNVLQGQEPVKF